MRRAYDDRTQMEVSGHSRGDDTLTKAHNISDNNAIVIFYGLYRHLNGIYLVFKVGICPIGNIAWLQKILVIRLREIFL